MEGTPSCCWGKGERREGKDEWREGQQGEGRGDRGEGRGRGGGGRRKGEREKIMKNGGRGIRGKREV